MALKIDLKPNERLIINGVSIRNGDRRASLTFETQAKFLRERDILTESEAVTSCERLYVLLEAIYLTDNPSELENEFIIQANVLMAAAPSMAPYLATIFERFSNGEYYAALKSGQELMKYERNLLDIIATKNDDRDHALSKASTN
ncbi:flagellar biosynthesis repressor FlbT [Methylobacterium sp. J-078]|uniref:flagellar biosynthesis repressor FlbT n=1 Tax=Methylobacterium sp. J-078 TaxID=2836657 RepID=UPI001FBB0E41|nr:flagellar biosynthesis repressor FlbT [Methylobacterium sp. J-078]MCJ2043504.1 flagellar biosynthesis repressor FlbT [Methylobacterium sp. J-078]